MADLPVKPKVKKPRTREVSTNFIEFSLSRKPRTISDALRLACRAAGKLGLSVNRIAQEAGVHQGQLNKFVRNNDAVCNSTMIDALGTYFRLSFEFRPRLDVRHVTGRGGKQPDYWIVRDGNTGEVHEANSCNAARKLRIELGLSPSESTIEPVFEDH